MNDVLARYEAMKNNPNLNMRGAYGGYAEPTGPAAVQVPAAGGGFDFVTPTSGGGSGSGGLLTNQPTSYQGGGQGGQGYAHREVQDTDTVQHHLAQISAKDSPLNRLAVSKANNKMAGRGLLFSSMAADAAMGAVLDRALPVAQQDAGTYFNQGRANQDYDNQFRTQGNEFAWRSGENALDRGHDVAMLDRQNEHQRDSWAWQERENQANREAQFRMQAEQNQNDLARLGYQFQLDQYNVGSQYAAVTTQNALNSINQIQVDPNLDPDAKRNAIQNVVDVTNANLQWASTFYNTPLPSVATPGGTPSILNPDSGYQRPDLPAPAQAGVGSQPAGRTTPEQASSWVQNAYQSVLGFPPDAQGISYWSGEVLRNNWTERMLHDEIKRASGL